MTRVVDEIKARLDLVDVVSETVTLRKSGRNYTGFCPFHPNTNTPSFVVFPETQTWRCFGACADGGDIVNFVMKRDGFGFKEALQTLAERAGIKLEPGAGSQPPSQQFNKLLELNGAAAAYFHQLLTGSPAGAGLRSYLKNRSLTPETVATFQLGYALDEWEALKKHFLERGYSETELIAAGLLVEREDGSGSYDRFRQRLMIPIRDLRGRVIGFGARALAEGQVPKYLNSPQTELFDKSATLYGLDLARQPIRQADQAVIVEGYMDVIQAHQQGARNVVAQMGTALTEAQLKLLSGLTRNFVLALDADAAGNAATLRGLSLAREALDRETVPVPTARGLIRYEGKLKANIRIAALPPGQDPDDILREGLAGWQTVLDQALPVVDFYFQAITAKLDLATAKGKSAAVRELLPVLQDIGNPVEQAHYIQKLARLVHVDERTLMAELKGKQPAKKRKAAVPPPVTPLQQPDLPPEQVVTSTTGFKENKPAKLEGYCLGLIIAHPTALALANETLAGQHIAGLNINDFSRGDYKEIFKTLQLWTASHSPKIDALLDMVGEDLASTVTTLTDQTRQGPAVSPANIDRDLSIAILRLRLQNINEQINQLTFLQQEIGREDQKTLRAYTKMVEQFKQERKKLEHFRDALSLIGRRRLETNY